MIERKHTFHNLVFNETELYGDVYSKNDVDNVIAERDKVIEKQDKEIVRHKRKRCLALAKWCRISARCDEGLGAFKYRDWYWKWFKRWFAIAEQFKEAK